MVTMCMVVFDKATGFSSQEFSREFGTFWTTVGPVEKLSRDKTTVSFEVGGVPVLIGQMPGPIPQLNINDDQKTAFWPDARRDLSRHRAHWIVTVPAASGGVVEGARVRVIASLPDVEHPVDAG